MEPKIYSVEVTRESNAIVQVEANSHEEAMELARGQVKDKTIEWARKGVITTNVTGVRDKDDE